MSSKQVWRNATADSGAELYSFYLVVGTMVRITNLNISWTGQ